MFALSAAVVSCDSNMHSFLQEDWVYPALSGGSAMSETSVNNQLSDTGGQRGPQTSAPPDGLLEK